MRKSFVLVCSIFALLISISCRFFVPDTKPATPSTGASPTPVFPSSPIPPKITETPVGLTEKPAPSALNPTGPYVLYQSDGIWISNPDGSFLTQLTSLQSDHLDLHRAVSPQGDRLAMVVFNDSGLDLVQVAIPSGETKTLAHLLDIPRDELNQHATSAKAFIAYAILDYDSFAWQPGNGDLLAFMGADKGPTSDLYTYNTKTGEIIQLTNGPSQAIDPEWSPDGQYIWHYGGSWVPPFGGAIGPYTRLDGVWAVRISDGEVITEPKPKGLLANFVGWQDNTHYITYDSDDECFSQNLRSVDILTGKSQPIMKASFYYQIARSTENRAFLFAGSAGCSTSPGDGVFLLPEGQSEPIKLLDKKAYQVEWLPESRVFQAYPEALFSSDGKTRYDPPVYEKSYQQAISKQGYQAWEVIENQQGRVVVNAGDGNWKTVMNGSVDELTWDPIWGKILLIALKNGELYSASFPDFTPRKMGKTGGGYRQIVWSP